MTSRHEGVVLIGHATYLASPNALHDGHLFTVFACEVTTSTKAKWAAVLTERSCALPVCIYVEHDLFY
jgi:hypothetical protein